MADPISAVEKGETTLNLILIVVILGAVGYVGYQVIVLGESLADTIANFQKGLPSWLGGQTSQQNAADKVVNNLQQSCGGKLGGVNGYDKIGASGQNWSCTGPSGDPNDMCMAVSIDSNGNSTVTGPCIPAAQAN